MQFEESTLIRTTAAELFAVYANVSQWPQWDPDLESATLKGAFATGTVGEVHPKGQSKSAVMFCDVLPNHSFAVECKLPLCVMRFEHEITPQTAADGSAQVKATHRVVFKGLLSGVFGRVIGNGMRKGLPHTMQSLKQHAESRSTAGAV